MRAGGINALGTLISKRRASRTVSLGLFVWTLSVPVLKTVCWPTITSTINNLEGIRERTTAHSRNLIIPKTAEAYFFATAFTVVIVPFWNIAASSG